MIPRFLVWSEWIHGDLNHENEEGVVNLGMGRY